MTPIAPSDLLNLQHQKWSDTPLFWNGAAVIDGLPEPLAARFRALPGAGNCHSLRYRRPIPERFECCKRAEAYVVEADADGTIQLWSNDDRGMRYGCATLLELFASGNMHAGQVVDYPNCADRILKLFLPAADKLDDFKSLIDFAAAWKYNAVMLEIGGAMEFRRHPEINRGWIERCRFMNEYPGKTQEIQESFAWEKNSIHSENGGGNVLTQKQVKELIDHCRKLDLEVIPEMPSLSHSDYLLASHPELAERPDDPYADTYCPSNPDSRRLLFELLDEVIEVFEPCRLNFGHDEFYVMSHCPRCRGKSGMLLYAEDICAISDYLAQRGIRGMIWGEKLLNAYFKDGTPLGGSRKEPPHRGASIRECQEAVYPAIDLVPRSLEILHWYWSIDRRLEEDFHRRGFKMIFGNCFGLALPEWRRRRQRAAGVMISNWGATDPDTLQRNGILFELVYDSALLWNDALDSDDFPLLREWAFRKLYSARLRSIPPERRLEVLHTTAYQRPFRYFFDGYFRRDEDFLLGHYLLRFRNGTVQREAVYYGGNIASETLRPERVESKLSDCYEIDLHLTGVSYSTRPEFNGKARFRTVIALACNKSELESMTFEAADPSGERNVEFSRLN